MLNNHNDAETLPSQTSATRTAVFDLRSNERVLAAYFLYIVFLAQWHSPEGGFLRAPVLIALMVWTILFFVSWACTLNTGLFWSVTRDWAPTAMLLVAYRVIDLFARPAPDLTMETSLLAWDRLLLVGWKGKAAIEAFGWVLPEMLEFSYLFLYAVPPLAVGILYAFRKRNRVDRFLFTFLLGTLMAYAMLPHFPSQSPRLAFPAEELSVPNTLFRQINLWVLSHCDIRTSVFPSGHVAAAFSAAWGMMAALPEKRWVGAALLVLAVLVWMNTIYGRYHYAADGLVSLLITLIAAILAQLLYPLGGKTLTRSSH